MPKNSGWEDSSSSSPEASPDVCYNPGGPATAADKQLTERSIEGDFFRGALSPRGLRRLLILAEIVEFSPTLRHLPQTESQKCAANR
jgi:hypothetical protein